MKTFCKLFDTKFGQVVVMKDVNAEGKPCTNIFFNPHGLGVCSSSTSYEDTDDGWDTLDVVFDKMNTETVLEILTPIFEMISNIPITERGIAMC